MSKLRRSVQGALNYTRKPVGHFLRHMIVSGSTVLCSLRSRLRDPLDFTMEQWDSLKLSR